jgi:hypothetical protein
VTTIEDYAAQLRADGLDVTVDHEGMTVHDPVRPAAPADEEDTLRARLVSAQAETERLRGILRDSHSWTVQTAKDLRDQGFAYPIPPNAASLHDKAAGVDLVAAHLDEALREAEEGQA